MKHDTQNSNKLIFEKSPYLLQHAYNPVNWYPWCGEAFEKAIKENKPIFLSIGYSTCHWCHVMEHESFEDEEVAKLMNDIFISIKVDREERPDIDNIYMTVCQIMTGSGGWPLNIILTPDKKPFFAGTYFPKETRYGRMGMLDLIPRIKQVWTRQNPEAIVSANEITSFLLKISNEERGTELNEPTLEIAFEQFAERFDEQHGGFGNAPKFPTPHNILFLLRYWKRTGNNKALEMVEKTLQAMCLGGIYDHVGFGFHRYSTDSKWLLPHFEKMLYDQAMLGMAYIEAYQVTDKIEYKKTACDVFKYVLRDMTSPQGGFYSAEDADSEGKEGKFYLWTEDEIRQILSKEEADLIVQVFNVEKAGNFFEEATREKTAANILHLQRPISEISFELRKPVQELEEFIGNIRQKLFNVRENRIHPCKDDKILTDWNGLMIAALAKGAQVFDKLEYLIAAKNAANFVLKNLRRPNGRLLHRYRDGQSAFLGYLDDYVFFIWGLLELYEATFEINYLKTALELNNDLINHFWDHNNGGFYFTGDDAENLIIRKKEIYDGAIPSGNSVAMLNLLRLGRITSNSDLEKKALKIGSVFSKNVTQVPVAHTQLLTALDFSIGPSCEITVVGNQEKEDTKRILSTLRKRFLPNKIVLFRPVEKESPEITQIAKFTQEQSSMGNKTTVYVCRNYSCKLPTTDIDKMLELLEEKN